MKIEANISERIETGVLQVNDDWPGIFIRGDNALYYGYILQELIDNGKLDPVRSLQLVSLADLLQSCRA